MRIGEERSDEISRQERPLTGVVAVVDLTGPVQAGKLGENTLPRSGQTQSGEKSLCLDNDNARRGGC